MPRILVLADIHYRKPWFDWVEANAADFEAIIVAGDLLFDGQSRHIGDWDTGRAPTPRLPLQIYHLTAFFKRLREKHPALVIAACSGNHDSPALFAEDHGVRFCFDTQTCVYNLGDHPAAITCIGYDPVETSRQLDAAWPANPPPSDVLWIVAHHVPPAGTSLSPPHQGSAHLAARLHEGVQRRPDVVCSGHFHLSKPTPRADRPWCAQVGNTKVLNAGALDPDQSTELLPIPPHCIIDLTTRAVSWHCGEKDAQYKA